MKKNFPKVLFVGGGSGGHISIIKGLLDYLRKSDFDMNNFMVVGGRLGMISDPGGSLDSRLIPELGVKYDFIRGGKLHRALKLQTFKLVWGVIPGFFDSLAILKEFDPDIVFASGGYVTVPMVIAAKLFGKKVVLHEQTMTAGLANKLVSNFADKIFVTFDESLKHYPENKTIKTGNVLRKEIFNTDIDKDKFQELDLIVERSKQKGRPIVYVTGGSLGAHKINQMMLDNIENFLEKYTLIIQTGENQYHNDYAKFIKLKKEKHYENLYVSRFVRDEIGYILENSEYIICRPGANTLYELAALGKKAVMIPLWVTSKNDQEKNAKWFVQNFKGEIVREKEIGYQKIKQAFQNLDNNLNICTLNIQQGEAEEKLIGELRKIFA